MVTLLRFLAICATVIFLFQTGDGTPSSRVSLRAVKVTVCTDREKYSLHDDVRLNVMLENASAKTVYVDRRIFCCGVGAGLGLEVHDADGKDVPLPHLREELMPPAQKGDRSILVPLDSGFFYGRSFYLVSKDFFPMPGRYSVRFIYQSRLSKKLVAPQLRDLPALWDDSPAIRSEPVQLEVTQ